MSENKEMFKAKFGDSEAIHKAFDSPSSQVRMVAVSNPNSTPEHLSKALNDENEYIRSTAAEHQNASEKKHSSCT